MKRTATAVVVVALAMMIGVPTQAAGSGVILPPVTKASVVLPMASPVPDYDFDGAIIDDPSCYTNQLIRGTLGGAQIELPFMVHIQHSYTNKIWVTVPGVLAFDGPGVPYGQDFETNDLIWSYEIFGPMMGANSGWDTTAEGASVTPTYYGFTTYQGRKALCVTWLDVAPRVITEPQFVVDNEETGWGHWQAEYTYDYSRRNSFQVLVVDRKDTGAGNVDLVYNYDSIQWQTNADLLDYSTGEVGTEYAQAGWSMGIGEYPCDGETCWRGYVDGRVSEDPFPLPYPDEHWFPQAASGLYETYLDSSPTGLAVTRTNSTQVGRHVFEIRKAAQLLWVGNWTHGDRQYVALGDSYQSGEGAESGGAFISGTDEWEEVTGGGMVPSNLCHRSEHAYPVLLHSWIPADTPVTLDFWACSGAVTWQMGLSGIKHDGPPWNDPVKPSQYFRSTDKAHMSYLDRLGKETWIVTIGIGGNDADFTGVLLRCSTQHGWWPGACAPDPDFQKKVYDDIDGLRDDLEELYLEIGTEAMNATTFVVGYPRLFATDAEVNACWDNYESTTGRDRAQQVTSYSAPMEVFLAYQKCHYLVDPCSGINRAEQRFINSSGARLNRQIRLAALEQGAVYIDIEDVGLGREICSTDDSSEWFANGLMAPADGWVNPQSFHPNKLGHLLIAAEFVLQLAAPRWDQEPFIYQDELKQYLYDIAGGEGSVFRVAGNWAGSDVVITLVSPSGIEYTRTSEPSGSTRTTGPRNEYIEVTDPEPGTWTIEAYGADIAPGGESFLLDMDFEPPPNLLPTGEIQLDRHGSTVTVSAPGSVDPDGTIVEYWWDLGDGTLVTAPEVTHTYAGPGTYRIALILTDDRGGEGFVFLEDPIVIDEPSSNGHSWTNPGSSPEPEPSLSSEPQPGPSSGMNIEPIPEPSPSPSLMTSNVRESGSGAWLWGIGLAFLAAIAAIAGGLWHRQRPSREM